VYCPGGSKVVCQPSQPATLLYDTHHSQTARPTLAHNSTKRAWGVRWSGRRWCGARVTRGRGPACQLPSFIFHESQCAYLRRRRRRTAVHAWLDDAESRGYIDECRCGLGRHAGEQGEDEGSERVDQLPALGAGVGVQRLAQALAVEHAGNAGLD
jgi:hypothetical protein